MDIVKVDGTLLQGCPLGSWSIETYYRLMVSEFLPTIDKVIYLDCDILVNGSLLPLYETDITDYAIAACEDFHGLEYEDYSKRLRYPKEYGYFNAGVMLVNLTYWRDHDISNQLIKYAVDYPDRLKYVDQDTLNGLLYNQKKTLPNKYDIFDSALTKEYYKEAYKDLFLSERPVIVHYIWKPWNWRFPDFPFQAQWERARSKSPWKYWNGTKPLKDQVRIKIIRFIQHLIGRELHMYTDAWKVWAK